jgi:TRAP-type C4-dicarboxylate transport system substrate-binding protein
MNRLMMGGIAAAAGLGAMLGQASAQEFNLRWAHYLPNGPFLQVEESFAKKIEERTGGKVKITIAYAGALGGATEVFTLAGRGAVDMASAAPGYYPDQLLFWKASQIPFQFDTPNEAIETFKTLRSEFPVFDEEMDKLNVKYLLQQPLGSYYLVGPSANCDTLAGIKGKKIRAFGADIPKIIGAAGATPITLTTTEMYEALQRGTLDYANADIGNVAALKLYEVGKNICGPVMTFSGHMVVIGKRTWDRLPTEYQTIITEEAAAAQQRYLDWIAENGRNAVKTIEGAGATIKPFNPDEFAKWKAATPDLLQGWVDDVSRRGKGEEAKKVAERWRELIK